MGGRHGPGVGEKESGLDKNPRRVPEDRRATPDEVRAALEGLTEADSVRLEKYVRYRIRGLGRQARYGLAVDAERRTLAAERVVCTPELIPICELEFRLF